MSETITVTITEEAETITVYLNEFTQPGTTGASSFIDLSDTPSSYTGQAGKAAIVNGGETGIEFVAVSGTGTVTSVAMTVPTGLEVSGSPITASGTLAVSLASGYVIPTQTALDGKVSTSTTVNGQFLTGNVTIENITGNAGTVTNIGNLTGVVTSTNRETAIANNALSIAMTNGLQSALDGKSPLAGSSSVATVGTITSGTWQANIIAPAYLGTGTSITTKFLRGDGTWQTISGGGDALTSSNLGQFADVTQAGGATFSITATASISGTNTGDNAVNSLYSGLVSNATHTGDVTGATALTIANDAVTNAKLANMATGTVKARTTSGAGDPEDVTFATLKTAASIADRPVVFDLDDYDPNIPRSVAVTGPTAAGDGDPVDFLPVVADLVSITDGRPTYVYDSGGPDEVRVTPNGEPYEVIIRGSVSFYGENAETLPWDDAYGAVGSATGSCSITAGDAIVGVEKQLLFQYGKTFIYLSGAWVALPVFSEGIANDAVTNDKLADVATGTVKARTTASTGDPEDITFATLAAATFIAPITKNANFEISNAENGAPILLTKTGTGQIITLPNTGISVGWTQTYCRATSQAITFEGAGTLLGSDIASVTENKWFGLVCTATGTYRFI